jgi:hypothetical protein
MDARRLWLAAWLLAVAAHVLMLPTAMHHLGLALIGLALDLPLLLMVGVRLWRMR